MPLKYFVNKKYEVILKEFCNKFNTYIYMPTIMRDNYINLFTNNIDNILNSFNIKGFVLSNIGNIKLLENYREKYEFIANYTFNIFNNLSIFELKKLGFDTITLSPELNKNDVQNINSNVDTELIVYGNLPVMNSNYCLLGNTNKCYEECSKKCTSSNKYYLKDRMGFNFRVIPDNIQTITTIYNSKTMFLDINDVSVNYYRVDILDETPEEINSIIKNIKNKTRFEGNNYTNGNFNREV